MTDDPMKKEGMPRATGTAIDNFSSEKESSSKDFRLEEYKALRKEIEVYLAETRSQERYTLIAVGLIWSWLVINKQSHWVMWAIPIVVTAASGLRLIAAAVHFGNISKYIKTIERHFAVYGWEQQSHKASFGAAAIFVSACLLAISIWACVNRSELVWGALGRDASSDISSMQTPKPQPKPTTGR